MPLARTLYADHAAFPCLAGCLIPIGGGGSVSPDFKEGGIIQPITREEFALERSTVFKAGWRWKSDTGVVGPCPVFKTHQKFSNKQLQF